MAVRKHIILDSLSVKSFSFADVMFGPILFQEIEFIQLHYHY